MEGTGDNHMKIRMIADLCHLISTSCLLAGYYAVASRYVLWILLLSVFWLVIRRQSRSWPVSAYLVLQIILFVSGMLSGCSPYLMIVGCSAGLAAWDLILFANDPIRKYEQTNDKPREKLHFQRVFLAFMVGMLSSVIGLNFHFHVPFLLIAVLVLIMAFLLFAGLKHLIQYANKT